MAFGNYPQRIRRGQTWTLAGTFKSSGVAVNLTGYTGLLAVNTWPKGASALYSTTAITLGGAAGTFLIVVPATITVGWPANGPRAIDTLLIYDLCVTSGAGVKTYLMSGELIVEEVAS